MITAAAIFTFDIDNINISTKIRVTEGEFDTLHMALHIKGCMCTCNSLADTRINCAI